MEVTSSFISTTSSKYLTLTSYSPVILPASSLSSIRTDFLGCCHTLRPPPHHHHLRTRAGKRKHVRSPRLVVRASIDSGLILVVVAVTAFSAFAFAYCQSTFRKRKLSDKGSQLSDKAIKASPETLHGGNISNSESQRGSQHFDVHEGSHVEVNGGFIKVKESLNKSEEEETHQVHETAVLEYDSFVVEKTEMVVEDSHFAVSSVSTIANEHSYTDESVSSSISYGSVPVESATLGEKTLEKQIENTEEQKVTGYGFSQEVVGVHSIASPHVVDDDDTHGLEQEFNDLIQKPIEYSIFSESKREEIHTFYGSNHSSPTSSRLTSVKAVSPTLTSSATDSLLLDHKNNGIVDTHFSGQSSGQATGYVEEENLVANGNGGISHKRKDIRRDWEVPDDGKHVVHQTDESMPEFPAQILNINGRSPETTDAYYRLLRDGRLMDCINVLEDLEKRDLLDMDKIYHASFFKLCKKQRAVKEAFRFTKLIPNPTLSTFNMLMSVCASSQDIEGARGVLHLVQESGMMADCKLYTTLISSCAKSGKVDAMFEAFHQMANSGVEPNLHTFGALIDGCARAGQLAKAFGAYGILRSKNVKPDRVVFNALISACGQSGAVDRAFDVLAEMKAETHPIDPDHITVGALMKACFNAGQVERAKEVYKMIHQYGIKGTPEVYTIAVNSCSKSGDWDFACTIYNDMKEKGVIPDEVFFSALIDVAGHAKMLEEAFGILQDAKSQGIRLGTISYSSLMGACCNAKNWKKALELYEKKFKSIKLRPTVSTMNALITALCEGGQLSKAMEYLDEIKTLGLTPNTITYSMLMLASERKDDFEISFKLLSRAKEDGISPNFIMCRCITSLCKRRFEKACAAGEPVVSFKSGRPQIENKWTSMALMVYRETILGGTVPTTEVVSQVLGCLQLPRDAALRDRLISNLGNISSQKQHNIFPLVDGFGEYDPRAFSLLEEATSLGVLPSVSFNKVPLFFDTTELPKNVAEVYLLTILKGLKHRLAAGAKIPHINLIISMEEKEITTPEGEKTIELAARVGQDISALLRRLGIPYHRKDSKLRINGVSLKNWFQPKLDSPFSTKPGDLRSSQVPLGNQITRQQRSIRLGNLTLE